jgi:hypothetical protein
MNLSFTNAVNFGKGKDKNTRRKPEVIFERMEQAIPLTARPGGKLE